VSNTFCTDVSSPGYTTQIATIFAQFVDHDFTLTLDHGTVACCQKQTDPTCINVIVPPNDTIRQNGSCLEIITSIKFCEQLGKYFLSIIELKVSLGYLEPDVNTMVKLGSVIDAFLHYL
jgi:hypothetical protein